MKLLQIIALVPLGAYLLMIVGVSVIALYLAIFGTTMKCKGDNSRLIRWPLAIKASWQKFDEYLDIITSGQRARRVMQEIETGQSELPL